MENKNVVNIVVEAIDYLLEADLREENGWSEDITNKLKDLKKGDFIIINKDQFNENNAINHVCKCGSLNTDILSVSEEIIENDGKKISVVEIKYICNDCGNVQINTEYLYKLRPKSINNCLSYINEFIVNNNNNIEALKKLKDSINNAIDNKIVNVEKNSSY